MYRMPLGSSLAALGVRLGPPWAMGLTVALRLVGAYRGCKTLGQNGKAHQAGLRDYASARGSNRKALRTSFGRSAWYAFQTVCAADEADRWRIGWLNHAASLRTSCRGPLFVIRALALFSTKAQKSSAANGRDTKYP
jgi:hypothetical protein